MLNKTLLAIAKRNKEVNPKSFDELYKNLVVTKIRDNQKNGGLSLDENEELSLLRKEVVRLTTIVQMLHPEYQPSKDFAEHNAVIEQCKAEAKEELQV